MFEQAIKKFESLDPETERRCLEKFLLGLTGCARLLMIRNEQPEVRLRILFQVNEINRRVLKRLATLCGGDPFFTVEYIWRSVQSHAKTLPALEEMVRGLLAHLLKTRPGGPPS